MSKTVQFVGFTSRIEPEEFISLWVPFAMKLNANPDSMSLHQHLPDTGSQKFNFISKHSSGPGEFNFAFMKGRDKLSFPDNKARVIQMGGYMPVKQSPKKKPATGEVGVLVFIPHDERDLDSYKELDGTIVNHYEAYFENCAYGIILEYYVSKKNVDGFIASVRANKGVEAGQFRERSKAQLQGV